MDDSSSTHLIFLPHSRWPVPKRKDDMDSHLMEVLDNLWAKIQPRILFLPSLTYSPFPYPNFIPTTTLLGKLIFIPIINPKKVHYLHRLANILSSPLTKKMVSSPNCKWRRLIFSLPISIPFINPTSSALYNNLLSTQVQVLTVSFAFNSEVMICIQIK